MTRPYIIIVIVLLVGCAKSKEISSDRSADTLDVVVGQIANELGYLGFNIDMNQLSIVEKSSAEMAQLFNQIHDESQLELKSFPPLSGPRPDNDVSSRLAFYDPNTKTIIVKKDADYGLTEGYLAHELMHAYQDQRWGHDSIWSSYQKSPSRELFNITQYIIEGHAELGRHAYEQSKTFDPTLKYELKHNLSRIIESECLICKSRDNAAILPYKMGLRFVADLYKEGGWPLAQSIFENLPSSTEQILHPSKLYKDNPRKVFMPLWRDKFLQPKSYFNGSLGEAFLLAKLMNLSLGASKSYLGASGWDGDLAQLYRMKNGEEVLIWRIVFDREVDAAQLASFLDEVFAGGERLRTDNVVDWIMAESPHVRKLIRKHLSKYPYQGQENVKDTLSTNKQELGIINNMLLGTSSWQI